ncbi:unnamed protein product [Hymenolepis diminuta]|uniref:Protein jagged-1/2 predicted ferredoxin-like domain-containing protein n=1 Tax=Hymenolepis diminuta TaxID=6216 RepID=A0A564ZDP9_HYMDI|nr:unnamed protein product [Hymenolepis diminuta]
MEEIPNAFFFIYRMAPHPALNNSLKLLWGEDPGRSTIIYLQMIQPSLVHLHTPTGIAVHVRDGAWAEVIVKVRRGSMLYEVDIDGVSLEPSPPLEFCGYWSCLTANSDADPFACGPGEECRLVSSAPSPPLCITPPCYARAQCVNASLVDVTLPPMAPLGLPPALSGCRPGSARLTNQCARLAVVLARSRLPYGITVEDFCNSVKALPAVEYARTGSSEGGLLGMSCGLAARQPEYGSDLAFIEITLTSTDERIRKAEDGKEFVFVQRFAHNIATAIRENASANVTSNTKNPPSIALMMGAESQDYYWNTILHGVAEINVETVLVKDDEIPTNPLLVPLACSLVVAVGALFTCIICVCAHRKHQELMEKYSIKQPPVITAIPADQSITTPTTITHQYYTPGIVYTTSPTGQQQMTLARVQN